MYLRRYMTCADEFVCSTTLQNKQTNVYLQVLTSLMYFERIQRTTHKPEVSLFDWIDSIWNLHMLTTQRVWDTVYLLWQQCFNKCPHRWTWGNHSSKLACQTFVRKSYPALKCCTPTWPQGLSGVFWDSSQWRCKVPLADDKLLKLVRHKRVRRYRDANQVSRMQIFNLWHETL